MRNETVNTIVNRKSYIDQAENFLARNQLSEVFNCYKNLLKIDPSFIDNYADHIRQVGVSIRSEQKLFNEYISLYPQIIHNASSFVKKKTSISNVYHCSIPKAATRWMRNILADPRIFIYSGLLPWMPEYNSYNKVIPSNTIVTGTFNPTYEEFKTIRDAVKGKSKAFFVMRDPRDVLVSAYFSHKYSHKQELHIGKTREVLNRLSKEEGLLHEVEILTGVFNILKSWKVASLEGDDAILLLKYEDLTGANSLASFKKLFDFCEIAIPDQLLLNILQNYSFNRLSSGRTQGNEDSNSHYRKGIHGDWKNHFNAKIRDKFEAVAGDLVTYLGYEWNGENELGKEYKPKHNNFKSSILTSETQTSALTIENFIEQNLQLANQHFQKKEQNIAIEYYSNIVAKFEYPLSISFFYLGLVSFEKKELEKAQDLFLKAVTINNQLADAYYYLGSINLESAKYSESISFLKQYISLTPESLHGYFNLGMAHYKNGDLNSAIANFNQVISLNPNLVDAYFYLGEIYMKQQNIKEGIKYHDIYQSMKNINSN